MLLGAGARKALRRARGEWPDVRIVVHDPSSDGAPALLAWDVARNASPPQALFRLDHVCRVAGRGVVITGEIVAGLLRDGRAQALLADGGIGRRAVIGGVTFLRKCAADPFRGITGLVIDAAAADETVARLGTAFPAGTIVAIGAYAGA